MPPPWDLDCSKLCLVFKDGKKYQVYLTCLRKFWIMLQESRTKFFRINISKLLKKKPCLILSHWSMECGDWNAKKKVFKKNVYCFEKVFPVFPVFSSVHCWGVVWMMGFLNNFNSVAQKICICKKITKLTLKYVYVYVYVYMFMFICALMEFGLLVCFLVQDLLFERQPGRKEM